ncbi:MAG: MFS transporter [Pseudomonadota bacterium]
MERALIQNILKIYGIGVCHALQLIIPVFVPLLLGKGLSMSEILQTQAAFALTVAVFEVPSGYLADVYGRKVSLCLSALLMLLSYACLYSAETFVDFIVFEVVMGVALSLSSGSDMAMLFDSQLALQKLNKKFNLPASVGKLVALTSVAEGVAALTASVVFLSFDVAPAYDTLLSLQLLLGVPPLLLSLTLIEPPRSIGSGGHSDNARAIATTLVYGDRIVLWSAISTVSFGLVALLAFWTFQRYWELQSVPLEYFGFLWALHCLIRGVSAHWASALERMAGSARLILATAAFTVVAFLGMAGLSGWAGVACALLFPVCRGLNSVLLYDALNNRVDSAFRATINSVLNLAIRAAFIVAGPLLGFAVDHLGMQASLLALAALSFALLGASVFALCRAIAKTSTPLEALDVSEESTILEQ